MKNPKCFAAVLDGCDTKMSREHWFSDSLYEVIAGTKNDLMASGFRWHLNGEKEVSPNALASKILCVNHNSQLSNLDSEALRFFRCLRYETDELQVVINGQLLERWCLKVLLGASLVEHGIVPDPFWVEVLFGLQALPSECGLMMPVDGNKLRGIYNALDLQLHFEDSELTQIAGVWILYSWVPLYFAIKPEIGPDQHVFSFHPEFVEMRYPDKQKRASFNWNGYPCLLSPPRPNHFP